jgi:inhibitor of cysteine peptidase
MSVDMSIDKTFHGRIIELALGQTLELKLDENPTTGYRWGLENSNPEVITLEYTTFALPQTTAVGSGGQRVWQFRGVARGQSWLKLKHWRPWSGESSVLETFETTVHVQ